MGETTKIQWATHTFNPWRGCARGPNGTRVVASESMWREPLKWDAAARKAGRRDRVFCASLADAFEDWRGQVRHSSGVPMWQMYAANRHPEDWGAGVVLDDPDGGEALTLESVRRRLFRLIDATPNLDWLLLTQRPENVRRMWVDPQPIGNLDPRESAPYGSPIRSHRDNAWLGTSIACQEDADRNIPELLKCRNLAARLFVSIEPVIESVDLEKIAGPEQHKYASALHRDHDDRFYQLRGAPLDWVIVGGESGPNARPCNIAWIRSIVGQCRAAGVPVFVKQTGAHVIDANIGWPDGTAIPAIGGRVRLRDPKGGDPSEWPEELRVREVPDGA